MCCILIIFHISLSTICLLNNFDWFENDLQFRIGKKLSEKYLEDLILPEWKRREIVSSNNEMQLSLWDSCFASCIISSPTASDWIFNFGALFWFWLYIFRNRITSNNLFGQLIELEYILMRKSQIIIMWEYCKMRDFTLALRKAIIFSSS